MKRAIGHRTAEPKTVQGYKAAIHILADALSLDDDTRKDMQRNLTKSEACPDGIESCKDMTVPQLKSVWRRLAVLAETLPRKAKRPGRDEGLPAAEITLEQKHAIEHLFADVELNARGPFKPEWRTTFCTNLCGHFFPQTRGEAIKVHQALESMRKRGWGPGGADKAVGEAT